MSAAESKRKASILSELEDARGEFLRTLARVEQDDWSRETTNPGWTIRDVVAHVASGETSIQSFLRRLANDEGGVPADFDRDRYNASQLRRRMERSLLEIAAELHSARAQTLAALAEFPDAALDHRGLHARGMEVSLEEALRIIALHDREHTEDIMSALRAT